MTTHDLDSATDSVSSPADRARLIAATLAHAEAQEAQYGLPVAEPVRTNGWKWALTSVLFGAAAILAVAPPAWLAAGQEQVVSVEDRVSGAVAALFIQAEAVEAYRVRMGTLPESLDDARVRIPGIRFVRSNNHVYQLVTSRPDGDALIYDSARPAEVFRALRDTWFRGPTP